jgi:hypothetical protein
LLNFADELLSGAETVIGKLIHLPSSYAQKKLIPALLMVWGFRTYKEQLSPLKTVLNVFDKVRIR